MLGVRTWDVSWRVTVHVCQVFEQERYRALHYNWRRPWDGRGGKNYERWKRKQLNDNQWRGFQEYDEPLRVYGGKELTYLERCD